MPDTIWTIGHSNRSLEDFLHLLNQNDIRLIADVRRFPGSRKHPHFNQDRLREELEKAGIGYRHFEDLGGRRSRRRDQSSPNTAWRVEAFNAFADHMATPEFQTALAALMETGRTSPTAIMCAEAVPWQCHRRIIADALLARGWQVLDIVSSGKAKEHALTPFAHVSDGRVTYPDQSLFAE